VNTPVIVSKTCLCCDKPLKGRIDKKFCDDYCRSNYNYKLNATASPIVRKINNALKKNRRILEELSSREGVAIKVSKQKLLEKAFHFTYYTHTYTNKKGSVYYFCYEYGYLPLENDMFLIVKGKEK
jgi:hypothetical protein